MQAYDDKPYKTITEQVQSIKSLSGKGVTGIEIRSPSDPRPAGSVVFPVSSEAAVFLYVKGRVDMDNEISKAAKKLEKTKAAIAKTTKLLADPGYQQKSAASLQEADRKRLVDYESEAKALEATIKQFEDLKLE